jgi:hypothetical protein
VGQPEIPRTPLTDERRKPLNPQRILVSYMVPGGGVEPPRSCLRRILSPNFATLQQVASDGSTTNNLLCFSSIRAGCGSQAVAEKCRKVGNEQPSKQPLDFPGGSTEQARLVSQLLQRFSGCFGPQASEWSTVADCTVPGVLTSFHLQWPFSPNNRIFAENLPTPSPFAPMS